MQVHCAILQLLGVAQLVPVVFVVQLTSNCLNVVVKLLQVGSVCTGNIPRESNREREVLAREMLARDILARDMLARDMLTLLRVNAVLARVLERLDTLILVGSVI